MTWIKMGVFGSRLAWGVPLSFAGLVAACGARSGLDCLGESCRLAPEDASGLGFDPLEPIGVDPGERPSSGGSGNAAPPVEPPPSVAPDEPPENGTELACAFDGRLEGSIRVRNPADLERLEGCSEVGGDLSIRGLVTDDLSELRQLRRVGGSLEIRMSGSLEGLESLEVVGNLLIESLDAPSLAPLGNLRQIGSGSGPRDGALLIQGLTGARDLTGLGNLQAVRGVDILDSGSLASLSGLALPARIERVHVANCPALLDLAGLSSLEEVDELSLVRLNLPSLAGLDNLRVASSFGLVEAPALVDLRQLANLRVVGALSLNGVGLESLAGLEGLERADGIHMLENPSLRDAGALAGLVSLDALTVISNPALLRLPAIQVDTLDSVVVSGNGALQTGPIFPAATRIQFFTVAGNTALASLDGFSALQLAAEIDIVENPALSQLTLSQLQGAERLNISCNTALPEASLEPLRSLASDVTIQGNLGSAVPCEGTP